MKRLCAVAACAVSLLAVAPAQAELPKLSQRDAQFYMGKALGKEFGGSYRHGYAQEIGCHKRLSRTKIKCRHISWTIGDISYKGGGRIWYSVGRNGNVIWNYAFKIKRTNEYCLYTGGNNCTDVIRVR